MPLSGTTQLFIGTTNILVLPSDTRRTYSLYINDSEDPIYMNIGTGAVYGKGIALLYPGSHFEITKASLNSVNIYAIGTTGLQSLCVQSW